jgi:hypothetical protein
MPRKKKIEEQLKWLGEINFFVFQIENETIRTLYASNLKLNESEVKENVLDEYGEVEVKFIGRIGKILLHNIGNKE